MIFTFTWFTLLSQKTMSNIQFWRNRKEQVGKMVDKVWDCTYVLLCFPWPKQFPPIALCQVKECITSQWIISRVCDQVSHGWEVAVRGTHCAHVPLRGYTDLSAQHCFRKLNSFSIQPWGCNQRVNFTRITGWSFNRLKLYTCIAAPETQNRYSYSHCPTNDLPFTLCTVSKAICLFKAPRYWALGPICYPLS